MNRIGDIDYFYPETAVLLSKITDNETRNFKTTLGLVEVERFGFKAAQS